MRVGGRPAVAAQWQNTGGSSQRCPGFDSWWLPGLAMMGRNFYLRALCTKPDEESQNALKTLQIKICLNIYHQRRQLLNFPLLDCLIVCSGTVRRLGTTLVKVCGAF